MEEETSEKQRKHRYLRAGLIGLLAGAATGLGFTRLVEHNLFTPDTFVDWWKYVASGGVLGAAVFSVREASNAHPENFALKWIKRGIYAGLGYGMLTAGIDLRKGIEVNPYSEKMGKLMENGTGLGNALKMAYHYGIETSALCFDHTIDTLKLTYAGFLNSAVWGAIGGTISGTIAYEVNKLKK